MEQRTELTQKQNKFKTGSIEFKLSLGKVGRINIYQKGAVFRKQIRNIVNTDLA